MTECLDRLMPPSPLLLVEIAEYAVRAPHLCFDDWFSRCNCQAASWRRSAQEDGHSA